MLLLPLGWIVVEYTAAICKRSHLGGNQGWEGTGNGIQIKIRVASSVQNWQSISQGQNWHTSYVEVIKPSWTICIGCQASMWDYAYSNPASCDIRTTVCNFYIRPTHICSRSYRMTDTLRPSDWFFGGAFLVSPPEEWIKSTYYPSFPVLSAEGRFSIYCTNLTDLSVTGHGGPT